MRSFLAFYEDMRRQELETLYQEAMTAYNEAGDDVFIPSQHLTNKDARAKQRNELDDLLQGAYGKPSDASAEPVVPTKKVKRTVGPDTNLRRVEKGRGIGPSRDKVSDLMGRTATSDKDQNQMARLGDSLASINNYLNSSPTAQAIARDVVKNPEKYAKKKVFDPAYVEYFKKIRLPDQPFVLANKSTGNPGEAVVEDEDVLSAFIRAVFYALSDQKKPKQDWENTSRPRRGGRVPGERLRGAELKDDPNAPPDYEADYQLGKGPVYEEAIRSVKALKNLINDLKPQMGGLMDVIEHPNVKDLAQKVYALTTPFVKERPWFGGSVNDPLSGKDYEVPKALAKWHALAAKITKKFDHSKDYDSKKVTSYDRRPEYKPDQSVDPSVLTSPRMYVPPSER